jgi:hypothetical protein
VDWELSTSLWLQKPSGPLVELTDSIKKGNEPVHEVSHLLIVPKFLLKTTIIALGQHFFTLHDLLTGASSVPDHLENWARCLYRGADKSLVRPGRKQATATEECEFHISYL